jgi:hypothetical protein
MANFSADRAEELRREELLLIKSDADLTEGDRRLRDQQDRLTWLQDAGHDTRQAERLVLALRESLTEWQRHHVLIEQRIAYLRRVVFPVRPSATDAR